MSDLAARLWRARETGGIVDPQDIIEPASDTDAYAVQAEVMRLCGQPISAFKIGSTSQQAQRLLGTSEPGSCPVPAPYLHESPARIKIDPGHMPAVEGEFALRLGADLPARVTPYTYEEAVEAVDAVAPAIEVVGTRLKGGLAGKGRYLVTADSGANIDLVVGPWTKDWQDLDLKAHAAAMHINGAAAGRGTGARALGNPMNVLVWLANQQSERGEGLPAGMIISTGTCTGLDPVTPGDIAAADFGALGAVEIQFE